MNISKEYAQNLLNYLAGRPYAEVFQLINELQQTFAAAAAGASVQTEEDKSSDPAEKQPKAKS
jgi:ribosomal protein L12E/L44/L45/RPP1/RPP2